MLSTKPKPLPQTVLPRYTDFPLESESAPLLVSSGGDLGPNTNANANANVNEKEAFHRISGQYDNDDDDFAAPPPPPQTRRCSRFFAFCKRKRSQEPACENRRCTRRRKFARVVLAIIGALFLFHAVKFVYTLYTFPKHIQCDDIIDPTTTIELPLSRKIFFHRSLSTGALSVVHDEATPEGSFKVKVEFDPNQSRNDSVLCHGKFKRSLIFGAFTRDEGQSLPSVKQTTLVLPVSARTPFIGFGLGGHKGKHHCAEKMVRKLLNIKKKKEDADE